MHLCMNLKNIPHGQTYESRKERLIELKSKLIEILNDNPELNEEELSELLCGVVVIDYNEYINKSKKRKRK